VLQYQVYTNKHVLVKTSASNMVFVFISSNLKKKEKKGYLYTSTFYQCWAQVMKSKRDMIREEPFDPHNNNMRLIRRIEAVETRVAAAAPHATINRLTRRIEALESRPVQKERKESLGDKAEIEGLKHAMDTMQVNFKLLEEDMKQIKLQLAEMISEKRSKKPADVSQEL